MDIGWNLPPVSRQMSLRQFTERHPLLYGEGAWPDANIHSDPEAARNEGLAEPVASAPTIFALVTRAMMTCFDKGWIEGGALSLKMIKPVYPRNFVTAKGVLREKRPEDDAVRYCFDVWVEDEDGRKVVVGEASALIPVSVDLR
jgi:acyl dehydratase